MRWFKHMSDASDDPFIDGLEDKFGLEGYARWWKMLEIIARSMDKTGGCSATHSWIKWQSFLKGKRNKLETFLEHCQNESKITYKLSGNILEIKCTNLLKLRDEYNSKSGHAPDIPPDTVPPPITEVDTEERIIIKTQAQAPVQQSEKSWRENLESLKLEDVEPWINQQQVAGRVFTLDLRQELEEFRTHHLSGDGTDKHEKQIHDWVNKFCNHLSHREKNVKLEVKNGQTIGHHQHAGLPSPTTRKPTIAKADLARQASIAEALSSFAGGKASSP